MIWGLIGMFCMILILITQKKYDYTFGFWFWESAALSGVILFIPAFKLEFFDSLNKGIKSM